MLATISTQYTSKLHMLANFLPSATPAPIRPQVHISMP